MIDEKTRHNPFIYRINKSYLIFPNLICNWFKISNLIIVFDAVLKILRYLFFRIYQKKLTCFKMLKYIIDHNSLWITLR